MMLNQSTWQVIYQISRETIKMGQFRGQLMAIYTMGICILIYGLDILASSVLNLWSHNSIFFFLFIC